MDVDDLKRKRETLNQQLQQQAPGNPQLKQSIEQQIRDVDLQIRQAETEKGDQPQTQGDQAGASTTVHKPGSSTAGEGQTPKS